MNLRAVIILFVAVGGYAIAAREKNSVSLMSMFKYHKTAVEDSGHVVNCGSVPINLTWTPKDLSQNNEVTVTVNYTLPHVFDSGTFNLTSSLFNYTDKFDCDLVTKYGIPCPLPKGMPFDLSHKFSDLHVLSYVQPGTYNGQLQVWDAEGREMICIQATLTILGQPFKKDFKLKFT